MKYVLYEKQYAADTIDAATLGEWIKVGDMGGDCISATVLVSSASTPGTASFQFQAANRADKADAILVGTAVTVTTNGALSTSLDRPPFKYYRLTYAIASGSYISNATVIVKGDKA